MVSDLNVPLRIVEVATVREHDGLALSSRNRLLSGEERRLAPALYQVLRRLRTGSRPARAMPPRCVGKPSRRWTSAASASSTLEIVDPESMQRWSASTPRCAWPAIWLGVTRLIDNLLCTPPAFEP